MSILTPFRTYALIGALATVGYMPAAFAEEIKLFPKSELSDTVEPVPTAEETPAAPAEPVPKKEILEIQDKKVESETPVPLLDEPNGAGDTTIVAVNELVPIAPPEEPSAFSFRLGMYLRHLGEANVGYHLTPEAGVRLKLGDFAYVDGSFALSFPMGDYSAHRRVQPFVSVSTTEGNYRNHITKNQQDELLSIPWAVIGTRLGVKPLGEYFDFGVATELSLANDLINQRVTQRLQVFDQTTGGLIDDTTPKPSETTIPGDSTYKLSIGGFVGVGTKDLKFVGGVLYQIGEQGGLKIVTGLEFLF